MKFNAVPLAIFLPLVAGAASAAPQVPSTGHNVLFCEAKTLALEEGRALILFTSKAVQLGVASGAAQIATGECSGSIETFASGAFKSSGYCVFADRDGDKWADRWWNESGMKTGRWEDTGLSGKWKGFKSTGSFTYTDLSSPDACRGVSTWERDR